MGFSLVSRWAVLGALVAGGVGCVSGLIIGLGVHAATAWFATFEVGIPAAITGVVGAIAGATVVAARRSRH